MRENTDTSVGIIWKVQQISGKTTYDFRKDLLGECLDSSQDYPQKWGNIKKADYLDKNLLSDVRGCIGNKLRWIEKAQNFFLDFSPEALVLELIKILESTPKYAQKNPSSDGFSDSDLIAYDPISVNKLLTSMDEYVKVHDRTFGKLDYVWFVMYFAVYKRLPAIFQESLEIKKDMETYNEQVLRRYGSMTMPAYRMIVGLAKAGNVVALTELGELYYNGRLTNGKPQYQKAFHCFLEAAGRPDEKREKRYPLACWNMAYILFNYQYRQDLKKAYIFDLQDEKSKLSHRQERQEEAIRYCLTGLQLDVNCVPIHNLLGVILDVLESVCTENEDKQETKSAKKMMEMITNDPAVREFFPEREITADVFFEHASKQDYTEADNNLARRACKKALIASSWESQKEYLNRALESLKKASDHFGTWASNKLGEFYRTGTINIYFEEKETSRQLSFPEYRDDYLAKQYYQKAIDIFSDEYSAWASLHLLESYHDELETEIRSRCEEILRNTRNKELQEKYQETLKKQNNS